MIQNVITKIKKLHWNIYWWFNNNSPIFIRLNLFRFYSDWWKARKVFKRPLLVVHSIKNCDTTYLGGDYIYTRLYCSNELLRIESKRCDWKSKWNSVRFESVPYLGIYWRGKAKWILGLECPFYEYRELSDGNICVENNNLLYWEGVLGYLYDYNKDIIKTFKNNLWQNDNAYFTLINALKPKYAKIIKQYYVSIRKESKDSQTDGE